jgi:spore coat polysaccharide biosynthesis predicted glycosyltransferase SpsG
MTVRVAIRPDHGDGVGGGHLGRSLALCEALRDRGAEVVLIGDDVDEIWRRRWRAAGAAMAPVGDGTDVDAVVLDGYRFGPDTQLAVPSEAVLVVVDDRGQVDIERADLVLDQNLGASPVAGWPEGAELLLGPPFCLVRRDVVGARPSSPRDGETPPHEVLVSAGARPPESWWSLLEAAVVAAGSVPHRLEGVEGVGPVLAGSEVALLASGTTLWDALCVGVPSVVVSFVPNQAPIARAAGTAGVALDGGDGDGVSPASLAGSLRGLLESSTERRRLSRAGMELVDGRGADRVAAALLRRVSHPPR